MLNEKFRWALPLLTTVSIRWLQENSGLLSQVPLSTQWPQANGRNNLLDFLSGEQEELFNQLVDFNIEDVSKFCCENDLMYDEINLSQQWGIDKMRY